MLPLHLGDVPLLLQFIALDLRVRLLMASWSLEQLAGQSAIEYHVQRIAGVRANNHNSKCVRRPGRVSVLSCNVARCTLHTAPLLIPRLDGDTLQSW